MKVYSSLIVKSLSSLFLEPTSEGEKQQGLVKSF